MNPAFTNPITPRVIDVFYQSPPAPDIFVNAEVSRPYDCSAEGRCGGSIIITAPVGQFVAATQESADAQALAYVLAQGVAWLAACGYKSDVFDQTYNCPEGMTGDPVHIHFDAGTFCGATLEAANAAAQASADAQAEEELVCETAVGPAAMRLTIRDMTQYVLPYETTRLNNDASAWVGTTWPPSATPNKFFFLFKVDDAHPKPPADGYYLYNGSGNPRFSYNWTQVFSGVPPAPTESQFADSVQWAFKLIHPITPPKPPDEGTGPVEVDVSPVPHLVGIGQYGVQYDTNYSFTLRIENTGTGPLIFGTPTITIPAGEVWSHWSMNIASIPTIAPGGYFDVIVTGYSSIPSPAGPLDAYCTLTLPNNLPGYGHPNTYIDFSIFSEVDA